MSDKMSEYLFEFVLDRLSVGGYHLEKTCFFCWIRPLYLCYRERKYPRIYVLKNDCKDQIDSVHSTRDHVSIAGICISISTGEGVTAARCVTSTHWPSESFRRSRARLGNWIPRSKKSRWDRWIDSVGEMSFSWRCVAGCIWKIKNADSRFMSRYFREALRRDWIVGFSLNETLASWADRLLHSFAAQSLWKWMIQVNFSLFFWVWPCLAGSKRYGALLHAFRNRHSHP